MTKSRKKIYRYAWNDTLGEINSRDGYTDRNLGTMLKGGRELGVEVECEGTNLPMEPFNDWAVHNDGSLRQLGGRVSAEYVFAQPMSRGDTMVMIDRLDDVFTQRNVELYEDSPRTSVHVHVNQRGLTIKQICNQVVLYLIFEELLSEYCGKHRMGNLFCLRAVDSESIVETLVDALKTNRWGNVADDHMRYAGMNLASLFKFGTIEYRSMRCTRNFMVIKKWVDVLCRLKDKALTYDNPRAIVEQASMLGGRAFAADVLGVHAMLIMGSVDFDRILMLGVRIAQDLAYAVDWAENPKTVEAGWTGAEPRPVDDDGDVIVPVVPGEPQPPRGRRMAGDVPLRWAQEVLAAQPARAINPLGNIQFNVNADDGWGDR